MGKLDEKCLINSNTHFFVKDLLEEPYDINLIQFTKKISANENILSSATNAKTISCDFNDRNFITKIVSYYLLIKKLLKQINRFKLVYVFYPGHLNYIVLLYCFFKKIRYGIYIRGEIKNNLPYTNGIIKNASLLITNNPISYEFFSKINKNCRNIISYKKLGNELPEMNDAKILKTETETEANADFQLLFVGRVELKKGIIELIEAFSTIDQKYKVQLTIVGGGDLYDEYHIKIKKDKYLNDHIKLVGFIEDEHELALFYQRADLFVFPSHTEGFPRVLFDCMINKVPILTTMVGGIPGLLKDKVNCLKLELKDSNDIKAKIIYAINNNVTMKNIADNAYDTLRNYIEKDVVLHKDVILDYFDKMND